MRRILALLIALSIALLCGAAHAEAEDFELGAGLWLRQGLISAFRPEGDGGVVITDNTTGGMLYCNVIDASAMGMSEDALSSLLTKGTHELAWGVVTIDSEVFTTGENAWATGTVTMDGETFGVVQIQNGGAFILGMCINMDVGDAQGIVESIYRREGDAAQPAQQEDPGSRVPATAQALDGYYHLAASYGSDTNTNLFLTASGQGAISTGSGFLGFDYHIVDGEIVLDSGTEALDSIWLDAEGNVHTKVGGAEDGFLSLVFTKRETDPADAQVLAGRWALVSLNEMEKAMLQAQGYSMEMTFNASGSVIWRISTNGEAVTVAKGWGKDGEGYYLNNGDQIIRLSVDGDTLSFSQTSASTALEYTFAKAKDYELYPGLWLRQGQFGVAEGETDAGVVLSNAQTGSTLYLSIVDMGAQFGVNEETMASLSSDWLAKGTYDYGSNVTGKIDSDIHVTGDNTWATGTVTTVAGTFDMVIFVNGTLLIQGMCADLDDMDPEALMSDIYRAPSDSSSPEADAGQAETAEDRGVASMGALEGFYDCVMGDIQLDRTLFLTPTGHGRLDHITFDFEIVDGRIQVEDDGLELQLHADGHISVSAGGMTITFVKRQMNPADAQAIAGRWHVVTSTTDGYTMQGDMLDMIGLSGNMTVYPNGAIDWHFVTDEKSDVAQGWGVDEEGYYMDNGSMISRITINDNQLNLALDLDDGRHLDLLFERL